MCAIATRIKADRRHPITYKPRILPCRHVGPVVKPAWEEIGVSEHLGAANPVPDRVARVFRHFELKRASGLTLDDRYPLPKAFAGNEIRNLRADTVAPAQLSGDGQVERRQIPHVAGQFEPGTNGPDLLWEQRTFLSNQPSLVPSAAFRT